jgi:O-antigen/teichoic acid export membrane protein
MTTLTGAEARRAARNAGAMAAARIVSSGALFVWQLILGRLLGDTEFGVYGTVGALFGIGAAITSFSMSLIVIRDVARRPEQAGAYLSAAVFVQTALAALAYLGLNAAALALGYSDAIRAYVAVAAISLFLDMLGNISYDQLLAQEKMVWTSAVETGHILARIGLAGLALWAGFGLLGVYAATLLTGAGRAAILWLLLRRTGVRPRWPLERAILRPLLVNSAPLALSAFINMTYVQIDKLMTTSVLTEADTGHLNAAFVIIYGVVEILSTTVLVAIYPMMSRAYEAQRDTFRFIVEKLSFFTLLVGLPVGLVFTAFAPDITTPLFGADFAPAADVLRVLIWYAVITMIVNVFAQSLMAQNRQRHFLVIRVVGLAGKLALNLLLLPRIGVIGAALASVCAEAVVLALVSRGETAGNNLPRLLRVIVVAAVTLAAMFVLGALHPLIGMVGGGLVYLGAVLLSGVLTSDDWDLLYRLVAAAPGGGLIRRVWQRETPINW